VENTPCSFKWNSRTDTSICGFSKEKQRKHLPFQTEIRFKRPRPFIQDICNSLQTFLFLHLKEILCHGNSIRKRHRIKVAILSHVFWETEQRTLRLRVSTGINFEVEQIFNFPHCLTLSKAYSFGSGFRFRHQVIYMHTYTQS